MSEAPPPSDEKKPSGDDIGEFGYSYSRRIEDFYELGEQIGQGNFSTVLRARSRSDQSIVAVKVIEKQDKSLSRMLRREIRIMLELHHPMLVELNDIFESQTHLYLVMEFVTGGELFDYLATNGAMDEASALSVVAQLLHTLQYLHTHGVIHRDLKPENILFVSPESLHVKVADFGLAFIAEQSSDDMAKRLTMCGSPAYCAPELLEQVGYSTQVDMWAVGIITYVLLCGFPPFYADTMSGLFDQIRNADYYFPDEYWSHVSISARSFIDSVLQLDPEQRLTPEQGLRHDWLASTGERLGSAIQQHLQESVQALESGRPEDPGEPREPGPSAYEAASPVAVAHGHVELDRHGVAQQRLQIVVFTVVALNRIRRFLELLHYQHRDIGLTETGYDFT